MTILKKIFAMSRLEPLNFTENKRYLSKQNVSPLSDMLSLTHERTRVIQVSKSSLTAN